MEDYYAVLGVSKDADPDVIKAAYRALAKKYHPDAPGGSAERFRQISRAWEALSNPALRQAFDKTGAGGGQKPSPEEKKEHRSPKVHYADAVGLGMIGGALFLIAIIIMGSWVLAVSRPNVPTSPVSQSAWPASGQTISLPREDQQIERNGRTQTFEFTSPDGKSYTVDVPEGATVEQAWQKLREHLASPVPVATWRIK
jgi:curved DNA-binding protein CbpA